MTTTTKESTRATIQTVWARGRGQCRMRSPCGCRFRSGHDYPAAFHRSAISLTWHTSGPSSGDPHTPWTHPDWAAETELPAPPPLCRSSVPLSALRALGIRPMLAPPLGITLHTLCAHSSQTFSCWTRLGRAPESPNSRPRRRSVTPPPLSMGRIRSAPNVSTRWPSWRLGTPLGPPPVTPAPRGLNPIGRQRQNFSSETICMWLSCD